MNPLFQWAVGTMIVLTGALVSGIIWIIKTSKDAGRRESKLDSALEKLVKIDANLEKIPLHEQRIGQLENVFHGLRSDIRHLLRGSNSWKNEE